jgi:hypothetical protein
LVLRDVVDILHIQNNNVEILQRSNDHLNVHLVVQQMVHPVGSFLDLAFLIPEKPLPGWKPPKFLIFFDNVAESIAAAKFLKQHLPLELRWMIKWFNADMSEEFQEQECDNLKQGVTWGLCCTDLSGMVSFPHMISCFAIT